MPSNFIQRLTVGCDCLVLNDCHIFLKTLFQTEKFEKKNLVVKYS